jgi:hypothetical protein
MKNWKDLKPLGPEYFERITNYEHCFQTIDFRNTHCYAAPFGGPVAFTSFSGSNLRSQIDSEHTNIPTIEIYTASGIKLGVVNALDFQQDVIGVGWNDVEDLVIVLRNATVFLYGLTGELRKKMVLSDEVKSEGIIDTKIYGTGIVVYTKKRNFYALLDYESPKTTHRWNKSPIPEDPIAWTIIEPELTADKSLEIIISTPDAINTIGKSGHLNPIHYQEMNGVSGPFSKLVVSPSGKLLSCYSDKGDILIVQIDFTKQYALFDAKSSRTPDQMAWCGEQAVVCYWKMELINFLLVIGLNADYFKYQDTEALSIVSECDGLRIFSREGCEFLYPIPNNLVRVYGLNAKQGGANLVSKLYQAAYLFKQEK